MSIRLKKVAAALCWVGLTVVGASAQAQNLEKVTYNMAWLPQGSSIGVIVAQEKGFFKEAGLDVNIVRGYGGNRTANELDQGQYEFGYVDPVSLMLNIANGGHIRMVGAMNTQWPAGICFDKKRHDIRSIEDLKGLTMGGGSASPVQNVVPAWLELNGKPKDFFKLLRMDPAVIDASLVEGRIDLAECWKASNREVVQKRARDAQVDLGWIEYSDHKLNAYGSGFATRDELIKSKPDMVRKFLKGAYAGFQFAIDHPEEANRIMLKVFPVVDPGVSQAQIRNMNSLVVDPETQDQGLGYMRAERMQSTVDFIHKAFPDTRNIKVEDVYTNSMLK